MEFSSPLIITIGIIELHLKGRNRTTSLKAWSLIGLTSGVARGVFFDVLDKRDGTPQKERETDGQKEREKGSAL